MSNVAARFGLAVSLSVLSILTTSCHRGAHPYGDSDASTEGSLRQTADGGGSGHDSGLVSYDAGSVDASSAGSTEDEHVGSSTSALVTTGTPISSCAQLQAMENNLAAQYYLTGDIACAGYDVGDGQGFRPIGLKSVLRAT